MILIDTDILIDIALDRPPHSDTAVELLDRIQDGFERASIAWHTVSNLYYIVRQNRNDAEAREFVVQLTRIVDVAPTDTDDVRYAVQLPMGDFEDAMQVAAAKACGARIIVTRNLADFRRSPIPAMSPQQFLTSLN